MTGFQGSNQSSFFSPKDEGQVPRRVVDGEGFLRCKPFSCGTSTESSSRRALEETDEVVHVDGMYSHPTSRRLSGPKIV